MLAMYRISQIMQALVSAMMEPEQRLAHDGLVLLLMVSSVQRASLRRRAREDSAQDFRGFEQRREMRSPDTAIRTGPNARRA